MNRLTNYFKSAQLAKMHLTIAEEHLRNLPVQESKTLLNLSRAMRELITATNNIASIAFNQKPKRNPRTPKPKGE